MVEPSVASLGGLVQAHEQWRASSINLIASENIVSPTVLAQLASDLEGRYGDYAGRDAAHRKYFGTGYVVEIERRVDEIIRRVFAARFCELRALSGHLAGAAVLLGLCSPGDLVLEIGSDGGGHRMAAKLAESPMIDLDVRFLPFDALHWNVNVTAARVLITALLPRLVILGSSAFLFPHPVAELVDAVHAVGGLLAYDASHVFGLIAAGRFQQPLAEVAQVENELGSRYVYGVTGARLEPASPLAKLRWLARHQPDVLARAAHLLPPKDYLRFRLTGEIASEPIDAAGTMLYDLRECRWSRELIDAARISTALLPPIQPGHSMAGALCYAPAAALGLPTGIPVAVGAGDDVECLGAGLLTTGQSVEHLGTTGSILVCSDTMIGDPNDRVDCYPHAIPGLFLVGGSTSSASVAC